MISNDTVLTDLCRLAEHYGTDKAHFYSPFYDLLFRDRREKVYKVLEIGIGTVGAMAHVPGYQPGASLRMWRDYFPNAEIFGIDKDLDALNAPMEDCITLLGCDQSSKEQLIEIIPLLAQGGKFDLIVDDGSHKPEDQLLTFQILSPLLDARGLYIIEDANSDFRLLNAHLPENTVIEHYHGGMVGRAILIRGDALDG